jgi:hypothetical protein
MKPLFNLGQIVATPAAIGALIAAGDRFELFVDRHWNGDWGELDPFDHAQNTAGLVQGSRLMSVYSLSNGTKLWIITEADRSSTCLLLPEEY